jgi:hypothetical protein
VKGTCDSSPRVSKGRFGGEFVDAEGRTIEAALAQTRATDTAHAMILHSSWFSFSRFFAHFVGKKISQGLSH